MSEAISTTIAEANAEIYDRLLVLIEAGVSLLQILIAVCDADRGALFQSRGGVQADFGWIEI